MGLSDRPQSPIDGVVQSRWHLLIRGHGWSAVRMMGRAFLIRSQWVSPRRQVDSRLRDSSREAWAGVLGLLIICPEMGIRRDDRVINSAFVPGLPHRGIPSFSAIYLSENRLLLLHPSIPGTPASHRPEIPAYHDDPRLAQLPGLMVRGRRRLLHLALIRSPRPSHQPMFRRHKAATTLISSGFPVRGQ